MNDSKKFIRIKALRIIWIIITILWCVFIFSNSLTPADESSKHSHSVLEVVNDILNLFGIEYLVLHHFIRKVAHFVEFFVLGILLSSSVFLWKLPANNHLLNTAFTGLVIALTDETLQLFVYGRGSKVSDVWIDFSAVVISHLICYVFYRIKKKSL
jgi:VanZ family protein